MAKRLLPIVIIALTLTAPIYNAAEIGAYMHGAAFDQRVAATPLAVKLIKDAGFGIIFILAVWAAGKNRPWRRLILAAPFALAALASLTLSLAQRGATPALILAGLRWLLPFVVAAALAGATDQSLIPKMALALAALFLLSFALQVFQAFYIVPGWGFTAQGLAFRPPGIFATANSAAFLAPISLWAAWFYLRGSPLRGPVILLAPVSVLLAASGAGVVAMAAFAFLLMGGRRFLRARLVLAPVLAALILLALPVITARRDVLQGSLFGRAGIFQQAIGRAGLISKEFGAGTNSAVLLRSGAEDQAEIVDSTYTSVLVNTGWLGLAAFAGGLAALWVMALRKAMREGEMQPLTLLAIFSVMGFSTIITEAFPMNLVMVAAIGAFGKSGQISPAPNPSSKERKKYLSWGILMAFGSLIIAMLAPILPYEVLTRQAAQTLYALSAKTPAQLAALEGDLRGAAQLMPMRPSAYAHLANIAGQYAALGDWPRALDAAAFATFGARNDPIVRKDSGAVFALFEQKALPDADIAASLLRAFPTMQQKARLGYAAAWLGRNHAALFWHQNARTDGASSRLFLQNLAVALQATGNTPLGYEVYIQSKNALGDINIDNDTLPNPALQNALDVFESAVCKTNAREDEVAARLNGDSNWLLKIAGVAADQRRWADALLCYKKDEVAFTGNPTLMDARPPGPALRRAVVAALAQSPDAKQYLMGAFAAIPLESDSTLPASALRWFTPADGIGKGFGVTFANEDRPGVFASAGNAGVLIFIDHAQKIELGAEIGFAPGITPTEPITLALGVDAVQLATFVLQPGHIGWQLARIQIDLPIGYHTLDVWQVAPAQGGGAVNRIRVRN